MVGPAEGFVMCVVMVYKRDVGIRKVRERQRMEIRVGKNGIRDRAFDRGQYHDHAFVVCKISYSQHFSAIAFTDIHYRGEKTYSTSNPDFFYPTLKSSSMSLEELKSNVCAYRVTHDNHIQLLTIVSRFLHDPVKILLHCIDDLVQRVRRPMRNSKLASPSCSNLRMVGLETYEVCPVNVEDLVITGSGRKMIME